MIERVLIVDDDPAQRSLLAQHVQNLGYAAVTAEDGDRAVEILNASEMPPIAWYDF